MSPFLSQFNHGDSYLTYSIFSAKICLPGTSQKSVSDLKNLLVSKNSSAIRVLCQSPLLELPVDLAASAGAVDLVRPSGLEHSPAPAGELDQRMLLPVLSGASGDPVPPLEPEQPAPAVARHRAEPLGAVRLARLEDLVTELTPAQHEVNYNSRRRKLSPEADSSQQSRERNPLPTRRVVKKIMEIRQQNPPFRHPSGWGLLTERFLQFSLAGGPGRGGLQTTYARCPENC